MSLISAYDNPWQYEANPIDPSLDPHGRIESHTFPSSADIGANLPWNANVHNVGTDGQIALGILNALGNPGNIVITWDSQETIINPDYYFRIYTSNPVANCFHLITSGMIRFDTVGTYTIKLWGMWYNETENKWYYNSTEEITLLISVEYVWPVKKVIHLFNNEKLNPGLLLEASKTKTISNVDVSVLIGGKIDYSLTHISAILPGYDAKIFWNDVEKVNVRPIEGQVTGSFELSSSEIGSVNSVKIYMKQGPAGYNVCSFDIYANFGFSEEPKTDPGVTPDWWVWLQENGKWVALGGAGLAILYMMRKPSIPIVIVGGKQ